MPELPEVERARATIARAALGRRITAVDDADTWVCRPHAPGDLASALVGRELTVAHRRGKLMWCETSALRGEDDPGPLLGIHLGMSGRVVVTAADGEADEGGDRVRGTGATSPSRKREWDRFTLTFADGGELRLFDKRRLGRVRLDPDMDALGPDAEQVGLAEFRQRVGRGHAPVKARLLDQSVLAGVGNLLADETLWQARIDPARPVDTLDEQDLAALRRALRRAIRSAVAKGGVHTGRVIEHRRPGGVCPRCGATMTRGTVGSRTTWWCPQEQR
ncbi:hypothetical protein LQF12_02040 [Ruania suaedae]|uniref:DNA-formamidopyrimidine glycosylase family protein n=1 Tax=Ruania suaedae TaxID=2897774 RepID=UPI001E48002B|nr:DNA-formamidopyrimidine glycosylase family protein [Ruania suaedae]UFU03413.1 hypothetical protein LQF12_02040 [Ruania suaedae]